MGIEDIVKEKYPEKVLIEIDRFCRLYNSVENNLTIYSVWYSPYYLSEEGMDEKDTLYFMIRARRDSKRYRKLKSRMKEIERGSKNQFNFDLNILDMFSDKSDEEMISKGYVKVFDYTNRSQS